MPRWAPAAVVGGVLAWTALATPLSLTIGEYFAYYDPQSDPERLEYHGDLAAHVYTAGHWLGQIAAALAGAWVVGRSGGYRRGAVGRAALAGGVLGLLVGSVAIAVGIRPMRSNGYPSVAPDPTMLSEPRVLWCLLASFLCFPLWAILGAAVGGLITRRALIATAAVFLCQPVTLLLLVGAAAPPSSHPVAVSLMVDAGPKALLMPTILLAWAALATAVATVVSRRRTGSPRRLTDR